MDELGGSVDGEGGELGGGGDGKVAGSMFMGSCVGGELNISGSICVMGSGWGKTGNAILLLDM